MKNIYTYKIHYFQWFSAFVICICQFAADSQTYNFRNYSVEDGLPFVNVSTICQDSKGYLWCGGYGGATRFDGFRFINLHTAEGLPNNFVTTICPDATGNVWLGTYQGLACYNNGALKIYSTKDGLPSDRINKIIAPSNGTLWVATQSGLAYFSNNNHFVKVKELDGLSVNTICCSQSGRIVLTAGKQLYTWENGLLKLICSLPEAGSALLSFDENTVWAGTSSHLYKVSLSTGLIHPLAEAEITTIVRTQDSSIWIGGSKGLMRFNNNVWQAVKIRNELNSNLVSDLFNDKEGNLWVGSYAGLFRLNNTAFESFTEQDGLQSTFIFGIVKDQNNNLLVGTKHGLYKQQQNLFKRLDAASGIPDLSITSMVYYKGCTWIGTYRGLYKYDGTRFTSYRKKDGLFSDSITTLMVSKEGLLWIGEHAGLNTFDGNKFTFYQPDTINRIYDVNAIMEDSKGSLWIGAYQGGIFKYTGGRFYSQKALFSKSVDSFMAIEEDKEGRIYVGTFNGLYILDSGKVYHIGEENGLSSDLVYVLLKDKLDHLWVGTNQGLNALDLKGWDKHQVNLKSFSREEGFFGVECNSNSYLADDDQTLWFGTVDGLIHFDPAKLKMQNPDVPVSITSIKLAFKDTSLSKGSVLPWYQNTLGFEFTGFYLSNPHKVMYRYFLKGLDKTWSLPTYSNNINYSALEPGIYSFIVQAGVNGSWTGKPETFTFKILTPWWKSWVFRLSLSVFLILMIVAVFRIRLYQVRKKTKLESGYRLQLSEYRMKALRAQMNPHFIFNSLNSIQNYIIDNEVEPANKYLSKFARLIRQTLNNSEKSSITIREELECLKLYLELEKMRFDERFSYLVKVSPDVDQDLYEVPVMLMQPYVENAILHGLNPKKEKGLLEIFVELKDDNLVCTVRDNGIGRRRSQEMNKLKHSHESLGMKITQNRLQLLNELHNSDLSVKITDLENDGGTEIQLFIPIKN